jgi:DNA polymerase III delta subunit
MITIIVGKSKKHLVGEVYDASRTDLNRIVDELHSPSLFGDKKTYIIKNISDQEEIKEVIMQLLPAMQSGVHDVILVFDKLLAPDKKKIEKLGITITEYKTPSEPKESFNPFALGNALESGDKKKSWVMFHEVVSRDDEIEKTHGLVWWKLKDMAMKRSVFSHDQVIAMMRDMVQVYHESRLGGSSIKDRLEHFFLTLPEIKKKM